MPTPAKVTVLRQLKAERDDALRTITNLAGTLSLDRQRFLNSKLRELVTLILEVRTSDERATTGRPPARQ